MTWLALRAEIAADARAFATWELDALSGAPRVWRKNTGTWSAEGAAATRKHKREHNARRRAQGLCVRCARAAARDANGKFLARCEPCRKRRKRGRSRF